MPFCPSCGKNHAAVGALVGANPYRSNVQKLHTVMQQVMHRASIGDPGTLSVTLAKALPLANGGRGKTQNVQALGPLNLVGLHIGTAEGVASGLKVTRVQIGRHDILPMDQSGRLIDPNPAKKNAFGNQPIIAGWDIGQTIPLDPQGLMWKASTPSDYAYQDQVLWITFWNRSGQTVTPNGIAIY